MKFILGHPLKNEVNPPDCSRSMEENVDNRYWEGIIARIEDIEEQIEYLLGIILDLNYEINTALADNTHVVSLDRKLDLVKQRVDELERLVIHDHSAIEGLGIRLFSVERFSDPKSIVIRRSEREEIKDRILTALLDGKPKSMSELQKEVGVSYRKFYGAFNELLREGKVHRHKEGNRVLVHISNWILKLYSRDS